MAEEQLGYVVNTETYILATDADDANAKVKNGEGSVISRSAKPKPQATIRPQLPTQLTNMKTGQPVGGV